MINPSQTELTTAATDALVALLSCICAIIILKETVRRGKQQRIWGTLLLLLSLAGSLGAIAHGFVLSESIHKVLWVCLYASLGMVISLFMTAAAYDLKNDVLPIGVLVPLLSSGLIFWLITIRFPDSFFLFIFYEAVGMLFALFVYLKLMLRKSPGATAISISIVISLIAAAIQSIHSLSFQLILTFDHNGLFHIVQMPGVLLLTLGVRQSLLPTFGGEPHQST